VFSRRRSNELMGKIHFRLPSIPWPDRAAYRSIGLGQIARDNAAAWLPPGIAYAAGNGESCSAQIGADAGEDNKTDLDPPPAFLTRRSRGAVDAPSLTAA
jgi:hypothetical protein